ncbi:hypothetical protein [Psychromonas sp.]
MKDIKQIKQVALTIEKKAKTRKMVNRAFATLRTSFDFTYQD